MDLRETLLERKDIYAGRVVRLHVDTVELPDGGTSIREIVDHPGGVAILALDGENRVSVVRQYRYAFGRTMLEIPAGKLEAGETDRAAAARRELSEETGYTADSLIDLGKYFGCPALISEDINMYLATGLHPGECHPDEDEFLRVRTIPMAEAVEMVARGEIPDGKTQLGILRAKLWWEQNH